MAWPRHKSLVTIAHICYVFKIDHTSADELHRIGIGVVHTSVFPSGPLSRVRHLECVVSGPPEKPWTMPASALQYEIDQLKRVSVRLDSLAGQHPSMEDEIMSISGNVRSNAVLLELLLALRVRATLSGG